MGAPNWYAGYSTRSRKKYRHVINNKTKVRSLGTMSTPERFTKLFVIALTYSPHVCLYVEFGLQCGLETTSFLDLKVSGGQQPRSYTMNSKVYRTTNQRYVLIVHIVTMVRRVAMLLRSFSPLFVVCSTRIY